MDFKIFTSLKCKKVLPAADSNLHKVAPESATLTSRPTTHVDHGFTFAIYRRVNFSIFNQGDDWPNSKIEFLDQKA